MRLPQKDTATWRALVTAAQTFTGFTGVLLAMPEFQRLVTQFYPQALPAVVFGAGFASLVLNLFRKSVKNY